MSDVQQTQKRDDMTDAQAMEMAEAFDARAKDTADMTVEIEGMDKYDLQMVCSADIAKHVYNWDDVSHLDISVDPDSIKYVPVDDGFDMTMTAGLEIVFKDQGVQQYAIIATANRIDDKHIGFRSVDITTL